MYCVIQTHIQPNRHVNEPGTASHTQPWDDRHAGSDKDTVKAPQMMTLGLPSSSDMSRYSFMVSGTLILCFSEALC